MTPQTPEPRSAVGQFLAEMKRRHVVRFAIGYAAAAFVVLQLAEIVFPAFGLDESWLRLLVIATAVGFPPALLLAWIFDVTPEGLQRTEELPGDATTGRLVPRLALMGATLLVVGGLAFWMGGSVTPTAPSTEPGGAGPLDLVAYDPATPVRSLAVLPLDNQTEGATGQDYFTAGMQEELITQLSQIPGLRVASRTSTARYADATSSIPAVGRELGVDAVIEGAVFRLDDRVRINVTLYHAASETQLWSRSFDEELDDLFALQSEVALEIARAVQGQVSSEDASLLQRTARRDVDPAAADAYLRGRYETERGTPEGYRTAMEYFRTAVEKDSSFAPALAGLAGSRLLLNMSVDDVDASDLATAWEEAERALALDSSSWEAREVLTYIERSLPTVAPDAAVPPAPPAPGAAGPEGRTRVAVIRVPGVADSVLMDLAGFDTTWTTAMTRMGQRIEEQVRRRTLEQGPEVPHMLVAARQMMAAGRFAEAADLLEDLTDDHPDEARAWTLRARAEASMGDPEDAADVLVSWAGHGGADAPAPAEARAVRAAVERDGAAGYWRWELAHLEARRAAGEPVSLTDLASAHAALGHDGPAFDLVVQALRRGERGVLGLHNDPAWDGLRDDPRFVELVRQTRDVRLGRPG